MDDPSIEYGGLRHSDENITRPRHTYPSSKEDEFESPEDFFYDIVDSVKLIGEEPPDFDPFATDDRGDGKTNAKCVNWLTKKDNAYGIDWVIKEKFSNIVPKTVYVNHPHTKHELTIMTITNQYKKFGFCVVMVIPANTQGTTYWNHYIEKHRIGGNPKYKNIRPKNIIAFPYVGSVRFLLNGKPATNKDGTPQFSRNRYMVVIWKSKK